MFHYWRFIPLLSGTPSANSGSPPHSRETCPAMWRDPRGSPQASPNKGKRRLMKKIINHRLLKCPMSRTDLDYSPLPKLNLQGILCSHYLMRVFWISENFGNVRALSHESGRCIYSFLEASLTRGSGSLLHRSWG